MPRAKRYYVPGHIWHITQRCHDKKHLLKCRRDKERWLFWMRVAVSRFPISVLGYAVTSNHVHVVMLNEGGGQQKAIAKAMHLVSGRVGQEYNDRKKRLGAFWEDRYHATAVESGWHLINCLVYIDANMVRARVVAHPRDWPYCGYQEISGRKQRYLLISQRKLAMLAGMEFHLFREQYESLIEAYVKNRRYERDKIWTESLAVGNRDFVSQMKLELGMKARCRVIIEANGLHTLEELKSPYRKKKGGGNRR